MTYFDFYDLQVKCSDQIPAIFVLTVASCLEYNNYTFKDLADFRRKCLGLLDFPKVLFQKGLIKPKHKEYWNEFQMTYTCYSPQSYFKNPRFLKLNCAIRHKVQYLKLLSYRPINDSRNWIPTDYIDDLRKISSNPLIQISKDKIHFTHEKEKI